MNTPVLGVGSHYPILAAALARTTGPVLELGMGYWSTPMLHHMCKGQRFLLSVETDETWAKEFKEYDSVNHVISTSKDPSIIHKLEWSVVFVDSSPGESRIGIIRSLKGRACFIVAHDTEADIPPSGGNYGWKKLEGVFRYESVYKEFRPWTTVYSDEREFVL